MLTIACVLKSGGIYDARWVERLRDGVARHLQSDYRFCCLSDVAVPCDRIPLEHDWPGWWSKIEAFKLPGPVLYFDLDTAIVGDLTQIANVRASFTMLRDFYAPDHFGSGVMGWSDDAPASLYKLFSLAPDELMKVRRARMGDQAFIEETYGVARICRWQEIVGDQIVSYKAHCRGGQSPATGQITPPGIPGDARVVCLHGKPKFEDMPVNDPVRLAWEMAA